MANRFDDGRGPREGGPARDFGHGYADDDDRERLQNALNRPGFGRMGDDRDYLAGEREYHEDHGDMRHSRAGDRPPRRRSDARGDDYDAGMQSEYARNRVAGGYGRDASDVRGAGGEFRAPGNRRRGYGAESGYGADLGDPGTFGSGNHYVGEDYGTRDPRGLRSGPAGGYDAGGPMRVDEAHGHSEGDYRDYTRGGRARQEAFRGGAISRDRDEWSGDRRGGESIVRRATDEVSSWFGGGESRLSQGGRGMTGRGPKGYRRSDERIREDVSDRLTDDDYLDASDVDVSVEAGVVTLSGTVEDRWAKRRAEDVAERVSGVADVLNQLRVPR